MSKQLELVAEERVVLGKKVAQLRRQGLVPANICGHDQPSTAIQVSATALLKLLARGGNNVIALKVGDKPAVQALIKQVERNALTDRTIHVDFLRLAVTEKLRTVVQLKFVNERTPIANATVLRSLKEVMVECLPGDLPDNIEVDLSSLTEPGAVIRVGDLKVNPAITIITDHNDMIVGLHQQARLEKTVIENEGAAASPETPSAA